MPRGGARPGSGRKRGASTTRTREIADRFASDPTKTTPLEVMIIAMQMHLEAAQAGNLDEYDKAAEIAKDAAPYIHPRLTQTATTQTDRKKIIVVRGGLKNIDGA